MTTIDEMVNEYLTGNENGNHWIQIGNFLDEYYRNKDSDYRYSMIKDEPSNIDSLPIESQSFMAAMCHYLSYRYGVKVPEWTFKDRYVLKSLIFL